MSIPVLTRFLQYVTINTQSDTSAIVTPSTDGQMAFARQLADELIRMGLTDAEVDAHGYVMATLTANTDITAPVIGLIAHMDTSPDFSGEAIKPQLITHYNGHPIVLNQAQHIVLNPTEFPELLHYIGQDLVVTDGTTLLGADDKAGIAEIMTAVEYLLAHPEIKHGKVRICFTPDEEIGQGADHFDVTRFGADFAYTIDGGEIGELEYENFNAASAHVTILGRNVHPGYAKNKMRNAIHLARRLANHLPAEETPEQTDGYDGFFHLVAFNGDVEKAELQYIIRDFDPMRFNHRKEIIQQLVNDINDQYGAGTALIQIKDQYANMRSQIEPVMHIIERARQAMLLADVTPLVRPIRGGTDGARLSFMGLPTPNLFAGGHNFHGRFEFIPVQSMQKAVDVIVNILNVAHHSE